jgi:predicted permease
METLWQDIRYGFRVLGKNPGFTAIAVFTLALGIGANSGIFSVMQQVLLQRLPVPHPEELVLLYDSGPKSGHVSSDEGDGSESFSYPMYRDLHDRNNVFAGVAAMANFPVSLAFRGQTERAKSEIVSGSYFETLEVHPALGRMLQDSDSAVEGGNPVVVLGYGYWKKRFGGDGGVLNQSLVVNSQLMTIVGVAQAGFNGIQPGEIPDVYIPITMKALITPNWNGLSDHKDYWVKVFGRLKPGISAAQATAGLVPVYHALLENELPLNARMGEKKKKQFVKKQIVLHSGSRGRPILENDTGQKLLTLMGMVGLVLFITCANVAGLLTARGAARQKEFSVRASLGASRWRLVRQLVIESCLLAMAGAVLGLVIASWLDRALVHFASANEIANGLSDSLNGPVLWFTVGLALFCGVLFGVAPALNATRVQLATTLKEQAGGLSSGLRQARLRKGLVVWQITLTVLLVTSAWGFVKSLYNLKHVDLGLRPDHVLQFAVAPQLNGYDKARDLMFYRHLEDGIAVLPGVIAVSAAEQPLIADDDHGSNITVEGLPADSPEVQDVWWNSIGPGHFANLRIPLLSGREFTRKDGPDDPKVAIINETMAKRFFTKGPAVGKRIRLGSGDTPPDIEIVGVVGDSRHGSVKEKSRPFFYLPYVQQKTIGALTYYIRTANDPAALATSVRQVVGGLDASLPIYDVRTFEEQIGQQISGDTLVAFLALAFGALAAVLAAMGIYGLLAYSVTQRTREIGLRMALGAEPKRLGWMLFAEVLKMTGVGISLGIPLAYGLSRLINSMLYGVQAFGVASVCVAFMALVVVSGVATYAPVRRAMRIDPMRALRYE